MKNDFCTCSLGLRMFTPCYNLALSHSSSSLLQGFGFFFFFSINFLRVRVHLALNPNLQGNGLLLYLSPDQLAFLVPSGKFSRTGRRKIPADSDGCHNLVNLTLKEKHSICFLLWKNFKLTICLLTGFENERKKYFQFSTLQHLQT